MNRPAVGTSAPERTGSSAERSLRLPALVARAARPLALAEVAQHLGLPKAAAHRLCTQPMDSGHLVRDIEERSFSAGPRCANWPSRR